MESLRNFLTGPRLFIVIAACALPFVFLGTSSLGSTFQPTFGNINGENITEADMQAASNIAAQKFKNIYGDDFDFNELDEAIQLEAVKQELITQKVLLSEARSLGFINKDTIKQAKKSIIRNPAFQLDGKFDENVYQAQVNASGYTKDSYLDMMTNFMASELYRISIASSNFVTDTEVKELAEILEQSVDINFIKLDSAALRNQITNSKEEIREYYDNNQILFYSDEERAFKYIVLTSEDYADAVNIPEGYVENAYEDYLSTSNERMEIRFSHVMIEKENYDSSEEAFQQISLIEGELKKGAIFEDMVMKYSDDVVSKDVGGDLEYFDADIFPVEFGIALENMNVNEISDIIELDETFHILKMTEYNQADVMTLEEMKETIIKELINSESMALMNDDFDLIDEMIFSNESIEYIGESVSKDVKEITGIQLNNFNFEIDDARVKDYIFSPDAQIGVPFAINIDDTIIVLSLSSITEPFLQDYVEVADEVAKLLAENKAIEKRNLLVSELDKAKTENTLQSFFAAYDFLSEESFVDVKRYSSLLPQEVISEIFKTFPGESVTVNSRSGDVYIVDLVAINKPSSESIDSLYEQYNNFSEERTANNISAVINKDIFDSAKVNLNDLVF
ncbi:SurA N-terminal domain-containing protein [Gammaproteobacteria bacterium]|nr:SurA N-terminal domain-containing protein [Gammaproteobacteria bacterium]